METKEEKKERFRPYCAALLLLFKGDKILLQRRAKTGYADGWYSVVSGHIDGNEKLSEAMIREAREEAGIEIDPKDLKVTHIDHRISKDKREYIDVFFSCSKWKGEPKIIETEKHDDLSWFLPDSMPEKVLPFVINAIKNSKDNIFFSEFGWESAEF